MADRPFCVLGVQQLAMGSLDPDAMLKFWRDLMGLHVGELNVVMKAENVAEHILRIGLGLRSVEVDLMTPLDPEKKPRVHDPALNHIGLWVDRLPEAVEYLTANGVQFTPGGIRKGAAGHDVCFIHPKSAVGVLVELIQAPPDVIEAFRSRDDAVS